MAITLIVGVVYGVAALMYILPKWGCDWKEWITTKAPWNYVFTYMLDKTVLKPGLINDHLKKISVNLHFFLKVLSYKIVDLRLGFWHLLTKMRGGGALYLITYSTGIFCGEYFR